MKPFLKPSFSTDYQRLAPMLDEPGYSEQASHALDAAVQAAERLQQPEINAEMLLLGILSDSQNRACRTLADEYGIAAAELSTRLAERIAPGVEPCAGRLGWGASGNAAITAAWAAVHDLAHGYFGTEHLLLGILQQEHTLAAKLLLGAGVDAERLKQCIASGVERGFFFRRGVSEIPIPFFRIPVVYSQCVGALLIGPACLLIAHGSWLTQAVGMLLVFGGIGLAGRTIEPGEPGRWLRLHPFWGNLAKALAVLHGAGALTIAILAVQATQAPHITEFQVQHWLAVAWCWFAAVIGYLAGDAQASYARKSRLVRGANIS